MSAPGPPGAAQHLAQPPHLLNGFGVMSDVGPSASRAGGTGSSGSSRKPGRDYAHFEDLVAQAVPTSDINKNIRNILNEAEHCLKKADSSLEFKLPDMAYVDYLTAYHIVVDMIPRHRDYPDMATSRGDLWRQNKDLLKRLNAQEEKFEKVKEIIKENNAQSGVQSRARQSLSGAGPRHHALQATNASAATYSMPDGPVQDDGFDLGQLRQSHSAALSTSSQGQPSQAPSITSPKRRPVVQPKPEGLAGRRVTLNSWQSSGKNMTPTVDPLAERFARLRGADGFNGHSSNTNHNHQTSLSTSQPPISVSSNGSLPTATMPSPSEFGSGLSSMLSSTSQLNSLPNSIPLSNRPSGPRDMPVARHGPPHPPKIPLTTQVLNPMPKAPSPTYSPARNLPTPANINPPRSTARSLVGTDRRINAPSPVPMAAVTPALTVESSASRLLPITEGLNGTTIVTRKSVDLPRETEITTEKLYSYLKRGSDQLSVLLIDVRSREEFDDGHIFSQSIICIEPIVLRPEMSADELEETLVLSPDNEQKLFARRDKFDLVVYYDQSSTTNRYLGGPANHPQEKTLRALTQAIYEFSYSKPLQRSPVLLIGGLDAWVDLVSRQALQTSNSAGAERRQVMQRRRTLDYQPFNPEEEKAWLAKIQGDVRLPPTEEGDVSDDIHTSPDQAEVVSKEEDKSWNRSYDDFLRRYPDPSGMQESMVAPAPITRQTGAMTEFPSYGSSSSDFEPAVPNAPSRPPPAAPRRSYSGVSEKGPYQQTHQSLPPPITSHRASQLDTISSFSDKSLGRTGLDNLGNTCYMNSVIQCLSGTIPLRRYFQDGSYKRDIQVNNEWGTKGLMPEIYANLIRHLWENYTYISPKTFRDFCGRLRPEFKTSEQQDAAEFLTFLMDYLHEDLNVNSNRSPLKALNDAEERRREELPIQIASRLEWDRRQHNNASQISSRFSVQYASRLQCLTCNFTSTSYGTEYCIPLEIPAKGNCNIYDCLRNYTKEERFEKENNWRCPSCKKIRESTRKITITRAPEILVINLKRFHNRGAQTTKIKTWVDFPVDGLDITPFVVPPLMPNETSHWPARLSEPLAETTPPFKYGLYGVVNHYGSSVRSGHYIALRRVSPTKWTEFNDRHVTDIDPNTIVSDAAYLLFFFRSGPPQAR